jgi:hypothetical protein
MSPIQQQFNIVHDCIRACVFFDHIYRQKPTNCAWHSLKGMCYSDAIITWNKLFGVWSQETHWKNFVSTIKIPVNGEFELFTKEKMIDAIEMTESQWDTFHQSMLDTRNTRVAHLNLTQEIDSLPKLKWVILSACFYREWLVQVLKKDKAIDFSKNIAEQSSSWVVNDFYEQIRAAYNGL